MNETFLLEVEIAWFLIKPFDAKKNPYEGPNGSLTV